VGSKKKSLGGCVEEKYIYICTRFEGKENVLLANRKAEDRSHEKVFQQNLVAEEF